MKDLEDKDFSIPVHRTNNLFLRFLANKIFAPIYDLFLGLYLRWGTTYRVKDNIMDNEYFNKEELEYVLISLNKLKSNINEEDYNKNYLLYENIIKEKIEK